MATPPAPLEFSARQILKGTLVPLKLAATTNAHGLIKYGTVREIALTQGETDAVAEHLSLGSRVASQHRVPQRVSAATFDTFRAFEQPAIPALRPGISAVAAVPTTELASFANAVVEIRAAKLRTALANKLPDTAVGPMMQSLNTAVVAARSFQSKSATQPLGMLNLERIEMVPAGIQRGELIATIPLAPGEETAVTHKEWSVTSKEFTTIVTDSLENTSETGVTDNTDLSQSTTSQNQHSTQFSITGTVQGGIPIISGSSTTGVTAQDADSQSATDSTKHATTITQKAAARSRVEHKTTIVTTTVTGTSETSTRILKNTSATDPIRIDYFSLMRKWRVRLYRFGLRLTYDMVIPEPAAAMRRAYAELATLRGKLGPFVFDVKYSDITLDLVGSDGKLATGPGTIPRYLWLAEQKRAVVKPFPMEPPRIFQHVSAPGNRDWHFTDLPPFTVPSGTVIREMKITTHIGDNETWPALIVMGAKVQDDWQNKNPGCMDLLEAPLLASDGLPFMRGATGEQKITFFLNQSDTEWIGLVIYLDNTPGTVEQWRADVWSALYNAAQVNYYAEQQDIAARISAIEDKLANVDTLTLRREESDEVMKNVVKFVLGTEFDFMPATVHKAFEAEATDLAHGISFEDQSLSNLDAAQWTVLRQHQDLVRFINQAIEWENVVTFLYSYFWDLPESWTFIRELRHPDKTRQAFLRAGSARVVLTVRKGWEVKWMKFVQDGTIDADIAPAATGPYLSIAQEIAAYDDRNYPGIPPANPERAATRLQDAVYTTSSGLIKASTSATTFPVASSVGFIVGLPVLLDVEDDQHIQEAPVITDIPDATHITVANLAQSHDGTKTPFPVLQPGDKGALIAEWNEYTPSSGTDIAVTSNLATIA
jgi:hypothetical protein